MISHKRGDSFDQIATIPDEFPDGHFVGWQVTAQIRTQHGALLADLVCEWVDPLTTRMIQLTRIETADWKVGPAEFDVQFRRVSDGYTMSTDNMQVTITRDVTQP